MRRKYAVGKMSAGGKALAEGRIRRRACHRILILSAVLLALSAILPAAPESGQGPVLQLLRCGLSPAASFAAGPGSFSSLDDEAYARLMDDTAEYGEISDLVRFFNPTYRLYADSAESTAETLTSSRDSFTAEMNESLDLIEDQLEALKEQRKQLEGLADDTVIDADGSTAGDARARISAAETALKKQRDALKKSISGVAGTITGTIRNTEDALEPVREQLTKVIEGLFISREQLVISRELAAGQVSLCETILRTKEQMKTGQLASAAETASAGADLEAAKSTLSSLDNALGQLDTAIGLQLGWSAEQAPQIGSVPAPDPAYPDTVQKEEDLRKALENNDTYQDLLEVTSYSGSSAVAQRDAAAAEAEAAASLKFESLYTEMKKQKLLYDAAQTSLSRAELSRDRAKRMLELGLTGNAEYEAAQLEYLSCEASARLASLSLFSAISEYRWAVKGFMDF